MVKATQNQEKLHKAEQSARFGAGEESKPAATVEINGHAFEIQYFITNRKCYDNLPTPTLMVKADGKRTSWKKAMELLA